MSRFPRAKKSLGQNFLHDRGILEQIHQLLEEDPVQSILEIGCGPGTLTERLILSKDRFLGIEMDQDLEPGLFKLQRENSDFIMASCLEVTEEEVLERLDKPYIIVGNLPYYITTPILEYYLFRFSHWKRFYLMVQKEVGQRMAALPSKKEYGRLSLFIQSRAEVKKLLDVKKGCFQPAPNVDSQFLVLERRSKNLSDRALEVFDVLNKIGFSSRRKVFLGLLKKALPEIEWEKKLSYCTIDLKSRLESLPWTVLQSLALSLTEIEREYCLCNQVEKSNLR